MKARVKDVYRWPTVRAFGGHEFTKDEWRSVPVGCEAEAESNDLLDTVESELMPATEAIENVVDDILIGNVDESTSYNDLRKMASEMKLGSTTGMKKPELLAVVQAALEIDEEE